ncbi:hypothetical protein M4I21_08925 [Cellulophaga sp. 20_2_10]|uniref:hypothetical protein n=1 Tax=Cellulophaga sp. 20_2_10 TaxID=2942476 RepID=UPI00201A711B|nr:hypothetical protein [Cellulophaga sp. 20_2_10]MCL5245925.1 hypothetical protein [Cellulophaga sp. 20_2_10]
MKTIITLLFVLFIGVAAQAQEANVTPVLKTITKEVNVSETKKEVLNKETEVARLYKFKNSKVKSALAFSTKRSKSKMA